MLVKTVFAGFGGQGVLLMGYMLAYAAMQEERHVTYMPSYGAEVRGGTANCTVAISNDEIASPVASSPECLVVMNAPSLIRFQSSVKPGGLVFINSTMVTRVPSRRDVETFRVPATKIAEDLGEMRASNIVMLGALVAGTNLVSTRTLGASIEDILGRKKELLEINRKAMELGMEHIRTVYPDWYRKKTKIASGAKSA
ncbi:MAG: 2-oxoacid:acceptor oxidoreductase family protein [bacterium]